MSRMQSPPTTRASFSVDEPTLEEFDELADEEGKSRSAKLRELVEQAVGKQDTPDEYLPDDDVRRLVYLACLDHATEPQHTLAYHSLKGTIAQDTQMSVNSLMPVMHKLERTGYIRRQEKHPMDQRNREYYWIKPRCADPTQWKYRHPEVGSDD